MAESSLRSVSEADEQLNTAGRLFSLILVLVACTALSFFLCFIAPAGIAVFFAVYMSLATLGVVYIGVERFVRHHRGTTLHVEHGAVTLYPNTTAIRFRRVLSRSARERCQHYYWLLLLLPCLHALRNKRISPLAHPPVTADHAHPRLSCDSAPPA